jgi:hypothetical protein
MEERVLLPWGCDLEWGRGLGSRRRFRLLEHLFQPLNKLLGQWQRGGGLGLGWGAKEGWEVSGRECCELAQPQTCPQRSSCMEVAEGEQQGKLALNSLFVIF